MKKPLSSFFETQLLHVAADNSKQDPNGNFEPWRLVSQTGKNRRSGRPCAYKRQICPNPQGCMWLLHGFLRTTCRYPARRQESPVQRLVMHHRISGANAWKPTVKPSVAPNAVTSRPRKLTFPLRSLPVSSMGTRSNPPLWATPS